MRNQYAVSSASLDLTPLCWLGNDFDDDIGDMGAKYGIDDAADYAWGISYAEPSPVPGLRVATDSSPPCPSRQLEWMTGNWRPDDELHSVFQGIGRDKHGKELRELWTEDIYEDGIVWRDSFFEEFLFYHESGRIPSAR